LYAEHGINVDFVCDDISTSSRGVLRGIHGDSKTYKLISCGYGRLYFVVLNCDESSAQYGQWDSFILTDANRYQVLVPPKFGNGHLALSEKIVFCSFLFGLMTLNLIFGGPLKRPYFLKETAAPNKKMVHN
jgi:dTDP-4-dehydrorhamnose 3,5-epimerase